MSIPKGADVNGGKTVGGFSDDTLREADDALTASDVVDRETGKDFWNIYNVERCGV